MNEKIANNNIELDEKDREIRRLQAENLELKLKVQNLQYFISAITRRPSEKTFSKTSL